VTIVNIECSTSHTCPESGNKTTNIFYISHSHTEKRVVSLRLVIVVYPWLAESVSRFVVVRWKTYCAEPIFWVDERLDGKCYLRW
jgi:hypothetical protein